MSKTYKWKAGFSGGLAAQTVGQELERIGAAEPLTPSAVVEAARPADAPLHPAFTWDDTDAAEKYRQSEARRLVSGIRVITHTTEGPQRTLAYVSVVYPEQGRQYMPTAHVMGDEELRTQALSEALEALNALRRRFGHLNELAELFSAAEKIEMAVA